jgi:hypothetical protein
VGHITIGRVLDAAIDSVEVVQSPSSTPWRDIQVAQIVPFEYDDIALSYTGPDLTGVEYRQGGPGGLLVATLTLQWIAGNLVRVTRT